MAEASGEFAFGAEVLPGEGFCRRGRFAIAVDASGQPRPVELVEVGRANEWREAKLRGADRLRPRDAPGLEQRLLGDGGGGAPWGAGAPQRRRRPMPRATISAPAGSTMTMLE